MRMDPRLAQWITEATDNRVDQLLRARPRTAYGVVESVDTATNKCAVYLGDDLVASAGFTYNGLIEPTAGSRVRVVIDPRGDRYVEDVLSGGLIRSPASSDASPSGAGHPLQVGPDGGENIRIDGNEVMSATNGSPSDLHLNAEGGMVAINNTAAGGASNGLRVMRGSLRLGTTAVPTETADLSLMFGADIELYRAAANELRGKTGDTIYGSAAGRWLEKSSTQSISNATYAAVSSWSTTPFVGAGVTYDGTDELVLDRSGLWLLMGRAGFDNNTTGIRIVMFDVNDTTNTAPSASYYQARWPVSSDTNSEVTFNMALSNRVANDRICLKVWQNSGAALNLTSAHLAAIFLGHAA